MSRKYSLDEIDQMRRDIDRIVEGVRHYQWSPSGCFSSGITYNAAERAAKIEDRLRTYMQNGTDPAELEAKVKSIHDAEQKDIDRQRDAWIAKNGPVPVPEWQRTLAEQPK